MYRLFSMRGNLWPKKGYMSYLYRGLACAVLVILLSSRALFERIY